MPRFRLLPTLFVAATCAVGLGACSSDDSGDDPLATLTDPPTTSSTSVPTSPPTTTSPLTSATSEAPPPTTLPATTTLPTTTLPAAPPSTLVAGGTPEEEALAAQVARDYAAGLQRMRVLEAEPTLENLDARVGEFAAPDSPFFVQIKGLVERLVANQEIIALNVPPVDTLMVEEVRFRGEPPYAVADVLACEGSNLRKITPAENSPTGTEIVHTDEGLFTVRVWLVLVSTPDGWKRYDDNTNFVESYRGQPSCDPA